MLWCAAAKLHYAEAELQPLDNIPLLQKAAICFWAGAAIHLIQVYNIFKSRHVWLKLFVLALSCKQPLIQVSTITVIIIVIIIISTIIIIIIVIIIIIIIIIIILNITIIIIVIIIITII